MAQHGDLTDVRLYIADDNKDFAEYCADVARREGWTVTVCHDGHELVCVLEEEVAPALLLVDIQMPRLDGIETIDELSQLPGPYRVRFVTGGPSSSAMAAWMIAEARDLQIGRYLTKPLEIGVLRDVLSAEAQLLESLG